MPKIHCLLYVTKKCNKQCLFCYEQLNGINKREETLDLRIRKIKSVLTQLKNQNVNFTVALTGGEPTIFPNHIGAYLELLNSMDCMFSNLNTNGYQLKQCINHIQNNRLDAINLSKHSQEDSDGFLPWEDIAEISNDLPPRTILRLNCVLQKRYVNNPSLVMEYIQKAWWSGVRHIVFFELYHNPKSEQMAERVDYTKILEDIDGDFNHRQGWQCCCDVGEISGVQVIFKRGNSETLNNRESVERKNGIPLARQLMFLPNGKMVFRFSECDI